MEWVVLVVLAGAVGAVALRRRAAVRPAATATPRSHTIHRPAVQGPFLGPLATVRLDVVAPDPSAAAVQRLATATAATVLRASPDVDEVLVEDREGTEVARVPRRAPTPPPPPTRPEGEVRTARSHATWHEPEQVPAVEDAASHRDLADRLDLPEAVRSLVQRPDDPVDVVRAILEAAGRPAEARGSLVRSGDTVVIVAEGGPSGGAAASLSQAFLRFRDSGAARGVVVHLGYVDPREVARRRALAPACHHAGAEVLQHMADAVALGGDPIEFALADVVA